MNINNNVYPAGEIEIEWGKPFREVAEVVKGKLQFSPYGGWPNLRCKCDEIFDIKTTEFELRAPFEDRPVMQVHYELSPIKVSFLQKLHSPFISSLSQIFGNPDSISSDYNQPDVRKEYLWGVVVYSAKWLIDDIRISLSVYGATRYNDSGPSGAGLFIDWTNELIAAKPYRAINKKIEDDIEQSISSINSLKIYSLNEKQRPFSVIHYELPDPYIAEKNTELRACQLALYKRTLIQTSSVIQSKINEYQIAIYHISSLNKWFISNKWDTAPISLKEDDNITFCTILPAKGRGGFNLNVNELSISEALDSPTINQIAEDLERNLGITIKRTEGYDD